MEGENKTIKERIEQLESVVSNKKDEKSKIKLKAEDIFNKQSGIGLLIGAIVGFLIGVLAFKGTIYYYTSVGGCLIGLLSGMIIYKVRDDFLWQTRLGKNRRADNWVIVELTNENKTLKFMRCKIDGQTIMIDGVPRTISPEDIIYYKKKPMVRIDSWSWKAYNPRQSYDDATKAGFNIKGSKLLLDRMKKEVIDQKKKINPWVAIGIIIVIIVAGYIAYTQGLFK